MLSQKEGELAAVEREITILRRIANTRRWLCLAVGIALILFCIFPRLLYPSFFIYMEGHIKSPSYWILKTFDIGSGIALLLGPCLISIAVFNKTSRPAGIESLINQRMELQAAVEAQKSGVRDNTRTAAMQEGEPSART